MKEEREEDQRGHPLLAAGGEENRLVAEPDDDEKGDRDDHRRDQYESLVGAEERVHVGIGGAGQHKRDEQRGQEPGVEGDVERRALVALRHRHPVRPRGHPDRPRAQPVGGATRHRLEMAAERTPGAADPDGLDEHRPDHELLPGDRLVEPFARVERVEAGGQGRQEDAHHGEHQHLGDVDEHDVLRQPGPVIDPMARQRLDPVEVGRVHERRRVDWRWVGCDQSHGLLLHEAIGTLIFAASITCLACKWFVPGGEPLMGRSPGEGVTRY